MKRLFNFMLFAAILMASIHIGWSAPTAHDWENPQIFARGQEQTHVPLVAYANIEQALDDVRDQSPFFKSLNGKWNFLWVSVPEKVPPNFYKTDFDVSEWDEITVPSDWQMQGYGYPMYRNHTHAFPSHAPFVPHDFNPVGCYKRTFTVPSGWQGRRILLHFEGVKSASYVWVNGEELGYDQGGMTPSEYDVTGLVKPGENTLAVEVLRYSDGTYLEDQDMWRLAGIYRDVYLFSVPQVHIRDFFVTTPFDKNFRNATLTIQANVIRYAQRVATNYTLIAELYDADRRLVASTKQKVDVEKSDSVMVRLEKKIKNPAQWSAEKPNMYSLVLKLVTRDGNLVEILSEKIGFRQIDIVDRALWVNGRPVKLNGVNYHSHDPDHGRALPYATMEYDVKLMKRFNINAVRTSHYPPDNKFLDLCDAYGIYVICEANVECHADFYLSGVPEWKAAFVDRSDRMVLRSRNHPSIIMWSAGNEAGVGDNLAAEVASGKKLDPTRPWMYGLFGLSHEEFRQPFEDVIGPRYPSPAGAQRVGEEPASVDSRPSFFDEYSHSLGNSDGHLDELWDVIYRYPRLIGGAIWDWVNQGIRRRVLLTPDLSACGNDGALMGRAHLVPGKFGRAVDLSGHDDWVEMYQAPELDLTGDQLTLDLWVLPRGSSGPKLFLSKGEHQFGIVQTEKDSLRFYLDTGRPGSVVVPLPQNWYGKWHHLLGVYDGKTMNLYVDEKLVGTKRHSGNLKNYPYPVCVGWSYEKRGQNYTRQLCNALVDAVRIFSQALSPENLDDQKPGSESVALWLDFDRSYEKGEFFDYGISDFCANGVILADRKPKPALWQVKKTPQPVKMEAGDLANGLVKITNRYSFTNLNELNCQWTVSRNWTVLQKGKLSLDLKPGDSRNVKIPFKKPVVEPGAEYWLLIQFSLKQDTPWAVAGHEVAWEQFKLPFYRETVKEQKSGSLRAVKADGTIRVEGDDFSYLFDRTKGGLVSIKYQGEELLAKNLHLNIWRAPIGNEMKKGWAEARGIGNEWRDFGLDQLKEKISLLRLQESRADEVVVTMKTFAPLKKQGSGFHCDYVFTVNGDGSMTISHHIQPQGEMPAWLPRIGLSMELPGEFQQFTWYGRGSFETYPDRKTGAKVGLYTGLVKDQYVRYINPQENGNKTDVRWATLTNGKGVGLAVLGMPLINVSVHNFDEDNMARAHYPFQLKWRNQITLDIDHKMGGVGGTPVQTLPKYRVLPKEYRYKIRLKPIANELLHFSHFRRTKIGK